MSYNLAFLFLDIHDKDCIQASTKVTHISLTATSVNNTFTIRGTQTWFSQNNLPSATSILCLFMCELFFHNGNLIIKS